MFFLKFWMSLTIKNGEKILLYNCYMQSIITMSSICYTRIGGSRGRTRRAPPLRSQFFHFDIQNFRNVTASGVHTPSYEVHAPLREILDPPLTRNQLPVCCNYTYQNVTKSLPLAKANGGVHGLFALTVMVILHVDPHCPCNPMPKEQVGFLGKHWRLHNLIINAMAAPVKPFVSWVYHE